MAWPNPEDYNEAVQCPEICFEDEELRLGEPDLNALGLPRPICGNFASVYRFNCGNRSVAVKCFLRNVYNQHQRYAHLSQFMAVNEVRSIIDFEYQLKGILVDGNWFPIVKMGWVDGLTLDQFLRKQMYNRAQLDGFLARFADVVRELRDVGIAHGDLQHGNIMVKADAVKLVDYDGIYVPAMGGEESNELGHANYQHKERTSRHFDATLDRFSSWIIHHTIQFLRLDPTLWQRHDGGDDALLFRRNDFLEPDSSRLMSELHRHPVPEIRDRAKLVSQLLSLPLSAIPEFDPGSEWTLPSPPGKADARAAADSGTTTAAASKSEIVIVSGTYPAAWVSQAPPQHSDSQSVSKTTFELTDAVISASPSTGTPDSSSASSPSTGAPSASLVSSPSTASSSDLTPSSSAASASPPSQSSAAGRSAQHSHSMAKAPAVKGEEPPLKWWPGVAQYTEAASMPGKYFNDPVLKTGRLIKEERIVGSRGVVFKISCPERSYAVKCFLKHLPDRKARFEAIARHDMGDAARYLVSFQYQAKGILIENTWFPILKMPWVSNRTLESYALMQLRLANKDELTRLISAFRDLVDSIAASGIAHGDLEPGNILINDKDNLKLVDYDAMYVPALAALESCETGNPDFQHPSRTLQHFGPYLDNFPALLIDSILSCMAIAPAQTAASWPVFLRQLKPSNSWHSKSDSDSAIARIGRQIREMGKYRIDQVPSLKSSRSL